MNLRHTAALALVGWYLMAPPQKYRGDTPLVERKFDAPLNQWSIAKAFDEAQDCERERNEDRSFGLMWEQCIATDDPRLKGNRVVAAIAANQWVLKVSHVKYMAPVLLMRLKGVGETGIGVFVDKPENVREVGGKVPSQLDGVRVLVREIPVWCLSVRLGKDIAKDCANCAVTLELEAHSCEKEFKTKAQCELGAAKYVRDWYVDADKNGDVVVLAPTAECWELTDPTPSHWDPITEKAAPDNQ